MWKIRDCPVARCAVFGNCRAAPRLDVAVLLPRAAWPWGGFLAGRWSWIWSSVVQSIEPSMHLLRLLMLSMRRTSWLHGQHSAHFTWGFSGWLMAVLTSTYKSSYEIMTQLPPESVVVFCLLFLFCNGKHLDHQVNIHNRWYMSGTEAFQSVVPRTPKLIGAWGCGGCKLPCTK